MFRTNDLRISLKKQDNDKLITVPWIEFSILCNIRSKHFSQNKRFTSNLRWSTWTICSVTISNSIERMLTSDKDDKEESYNFVTSFYGAFFNIGNRRKRNSWYNFEKYNKDRSKGYAK